MSFSSRCTLSLTALVALAACALVSPYEPPALPVPEAFVMPPLSALNSASALENKVSFAMPWSTFFRDELLKKRIQDALVKNFDVRVAALSVQESRAQYGVVNADRLPSLNIGGSNETTGGAQRDIRRNYLANVTLSSFELDFFGRVKNLSDAALARYLASEAAAKTVRLLLIKEVALAHYTLGFAKARLLIAQNTLKNARLSHDLLAARVRGGQASAFDFARSQAQIKFLESTLAKQTREIIQAQNALALLLTQFVDAAPAETEMALSDVQFAPLSRNLSSQILLHRPDVIEAENNLHAGYADIGAARAAFFPQISLTGTLGYMSADIASLFSGASALWTFLPSISLPIFTAGKNANTLELATIRKDILVLRYEKAIQNAFRDIRDALMAQDYFAQERATQDEAVRALAQAEALAYGRFVRGGTSYQEVLDAERAHFDASLVYLDVLQGELQNTINLYIALGSADDVAPEGKPNAEHS